ncbi:hypothetical protein V2J09_007389 [Rumex salicifolius]
MVIEAVEQGIPQIPFDLFVKKKCKGLLNITNSFKSQVYTVQIAACSDRHRRKRVLLNPSGVILITIYRYHDGSWRGFKGDDVADENLLFRVNRTLNTFDRIELDVFIIQQNGEESIFKIKGSVFWRSCTIYRGNQIAAQTSMMYTLGFRKIFVSRDKFRVTLFPGYSDFSILAALVAVFMDGRK